MSITVVEYRNAAVAFVVGDALCSLLFESFWGHTFFG